VNLNSAVRPAALSKSIDPEVFVTEAVITRKVNCAAVGKLSQFSALGPIKLVELPDLG
jgi:hypothetical protein